MILNCRYLISLVMIFSLSACSISNLKLKGSVDRGVYYSPDKEFKVNVPSYGYSINDTQIREFKDKELIGVLFGPTFYVDNNIYGVVLTKKKLPDNKNKRIEYVKKLFEKKIKSRNRELTQIEYTQFSIKDREAYYAVYKDTFFENSEKYVLLSLVNNGDSFYTIDSDVFSKHRNNRFSSEAQLVKRKWSVFNSLLLSFTVDNIKLDNNLSIEEVQKIDQVLLSNVGQSWRKISNVVTTTMTELSEKIPGVPDVYYENRVHYLIDEDMLESKGDLRYIGFSYVRIPLEEF